MSETQETVHSWIQETFPGTDPESPRKSIRALEEMVELCLASGAKYRDIQIAVAKVLEKEGATMSLLGGLMDVAGGTLDPAKIAVEAADVLIVLYGVAGMRGFDLHAEVDRKMKTNRSRTWHALGDGTGYHIRDVENPEKQGVS
jgi:hypothetical protein